MIFDGIFAPTGDEDDFLNPRIHCLLHHVLNGGDINDRQELFGYGFGGWEKARTQARHGYDGFFELHRHPD